jgi:hypothetical protein
MAPPCTRSPACIAHSTCSRSLKYTMYLRPRAAVTTRAPGELVERGEGRLVREVVLARLHDAAADRAALAGDRGRGDQLHGRVGEDLVEGARDLHLRDILRKAATFGVGS